MSWRGARPRRLFGASALAGLGLYSLVTIASAPATVLAGGCSKSSPQADIAATQSAVGTYSAGIAQSVTFTLTAENAGPCSASNVTLTDTIADTSFASLTITTVSTNPSSATCTPATGSSTTSGTITCSFAKMSAPSDANRNNPGTGQVIFTVTNPGGNLGGTNAAPVTSVGTITQAGPTTDPQPGNNTSQGAFLVDGGSLTFGGFQSTTISVAKGQGIHGSAEIYSGVNDPNPPKGSFGQIVRINSDAFLDSGGNPISPLQTVTFDVPITNSTPQSISKVHVWHELDGTTTWVQLPNCTTNPVQPDPSPSCVFSILKLKGGPTGAYFEVVVYTTSTSKWIT